MFRNGFESPAAAPDRRSLRAAQAEADAICARASANRVRAPRAKKVFRSYAKVSSRYILFTQKARIA